MLERFLIIGGIVALCGLIFLFQATNPSTIGPLGILVVFVFFYIFSVCVLTPIIMFLWKLRGRFSVLQRHAAPLLSLRKAYYYASVVALVPTILIAIRTVGTVGIYDVILVALFVIVACVYISKRMQ